MENCCWGRTNRSNGERIRCSHYSYMGGGAMHNILCHMLLFFFFFQKVLPDSPFPYHPFTVNKFCELSLWGGGGGGGGGRGKFFPFRSDPFQKKKSKKLF